MGDGEIDQRALLSGTGLVTRPSFRTLKLRLQSFVLSLTPAIATFHKGLVSASNIITRVDGFSSGRCGSRLQLFVHGNAPVLGCKVAEERHDALDIFPRHRVVEQPLSWEPRH
jgi:hypothetical protein